MTAWSELWPNLFKLDICLDKLSFSASAETAMIYVSYRTRASLIGLLHGHNEFYECPQGFGDCVNYEMLICKFRGYIVFVVV